MTPPLLSFLFLSFQSLLKLTPEAAPGAQCPLYILSQLHAGLFPSCASLVHFLFHICLLCFPCVIPDI